MKKRITVLFLGIIFSLSFFSGCELSDRYGFYHQSMLNRYYIPDLPKIRKDDTSLENGKFAYIATDTEYMDYVESVYEYLVSCSFEYLGYPTKVISGAPWANYEIELGTELEDFKITKELYDGIDHGDIEYFFVWGNDLDNEYSSLITKGGYMKIKHYTGAVKHYNTFIELPYSLIGTQFYLANTN